MGRLPKLECDSSAIFGMTPKRSISSAAWIVMLAISSADGFSLTCVSVTNRVWFGSISTFSAP
ncbi:Uncharacterised protein [Bordetella pertussis]|nr:Uncharacterised protein [Bordetella pertussis]